MVPETLNILEGFDDFGTLGHNWPGALHLIAESLMLAFGDCHSFYGDPALWMCRLKLANRCLRRVFSG